MNHPYPNSSEILKTKLYPPTVTPDLVSRDQLLAQLEGNRQRPLTLISAPAGYGKSALARMWLEASHLPGGWLSLDDSDNDLPTFARYLLAAIETAAPHVSLQTNALLSDAISPSPTDLAHQLLADLDQLETPFLLVLDDIHTIREVKIFAFLEALLNHPSPVLHLVLVGRQDPPLPIASWRAYNRINEIRARDLRFTPPETALFLSKMLQRDISDSVAAAWTDKTEGWIVALRLAALSLRDQQPSSNMDALIPGDNPFLQEYLFDVVLTRLPGPLQSALAKTALLDRFCASLCETICSELHEDGLAEMNGDQYIQWLQQFNLFLINLDDQNEWFRFHHLFQENLQHLLEKQLNRVEIAAIHLKASCWFAENGWVREAIRHALAADQPATAVRIFADNRAAAMNRENWRQLEQWVRLFREEVVQSNPVLLLTTAHLPLTYGYELEPLLMRAGSLLAELPPESPQNRELQAELAYFSGLGAVQQGPAAAAIDAATMMLDALPQDAHYLRVQALGLASFGHQMSGNIERGTDTVHGALRTGDWPVNAQVKAFINQTILYFMEADLTSAQISAGKGIELASKHNLDASAARCFAGTAYYLQNDLAMAERLLAPVVEHPARVDPVILTHSTCTLMRLYNARGKPERARAIWQPTRSYLEETDNTFSLQVFDMFQAELALDQGNTTRAHEFSLPLNVNWQLPIWFWHYYIPQLTPIKLWVAEKKNLERAVGVLEEMDEFLREINRKIHRIDVLALQALAYQALDNRPKAMEKLAQSVTLGARGNFIRNYLDLGPKMRDLLAEFYNQRNPDDGIDWRYVSQILDGYPEDNSDNGQRTSARSGFIDPLTRREQEVLEYLATDLSTQEIAEKLSITWSTARTHIKNIYSKLGVHRRSEAILHAQELELL